MTIRHWHRPKIVLLWVSYFMVAFITWAANVRINEVRVELLSGELALIWLLLFIPLFIVTWKWVSGREQEEQLKKNDISPPVKKGNSTDSDQVVSGLEEASNFTQGEGQPSPKVGTLHSRGRFSFSAISWRKITLILVVAILGATGGYWYKGLENHAIPGEWEAVPLPPGQENKTPAASGEFEPVDLTGGAATLEWEPVDLTGGKPVRPSKGKPARP